MSSADVFALARSSAQPAPDQERWVLLASAAVEKPLLVCAECELIIREVWARKSQHDRERRRLDMNLSDFYHFYLQQKYGLQVSESKTALD